MLSLFIAFAIPSSSGAMNNTATVNVSVRDSLEDANTVARITTRVYEIQAMDKTNLSPSEKKSLRKELKELKKQANAVSSSNHGVYLSIGAIIIIILLLILIL
jgi:uncharacterized protein YfkK (UPF0435 family)